MCFLIFRKTVYSVPQSITILALLFKVPSAFYSLLEQFSVMFAWRIFQLIVLCVRLWYQLCFCSVSLDFYLCLFPFVIGQNDYRRTKYFWFVVLLVHLVCTSTSAFMLCVTLSIHSFCKVGVTNCEDCVSEENLKVAQSHFISSSTKSLSCFQESEISLIPGCSNTPLRIFWDVPEISVRSAMLTTIIHDFL